MNTNGAIYATIRCNIVFQKRYASFTLLKRCSDVIIWIVILICCPIQNSFDCGIV